MGLDMYLTGSKYLRGEGVLEDGFPLKEKRVELGYWRKHPDLHGYIVANFADGIDDCSDIELSRDGVEGIIDAVAGGKLPKTSGFFFGDSDGRETKETIKILRGALAWMDTQSEDEWRSVIYRASW